MKETLKKEILRIIGEDQILYQEPMSDHTTFRVGGPAETFLIPHNEKEAAALLRLFSDCEEPFFVLGNGSNLLVSDKGYQGTVILIDRNMDGCEIRGEELTAQAGALLVRLASRAQAAGLAGLEFASGIPGTVGGAVTMNAGAYGSEIKDVVTSVRLFDAKKKEIVEIPGEDMHFSYRHSLVKEGMYTVLGATFRLHGDDPEEILKRMEELREKRTSKQPLEYPSAGSTFKRPEGSFAGKLIEEAGLKGYRVGGAMVSEKHAGFVINEDHATAQDIITLIRKIREQVYERSGILLEPEVCMLGEDLTL